MRVARVEEHVNENTDDVVMKIVEVSHPELTISDIDRCHRIGRKQPGKKRDIIVKFISYWDKHKVIVNRLSVMLCIIYMYMSIGVSLYIPSYRCTYLFSY